MRRTVALLILAAIMGLSLLGCSPAENRNIGLGAFQRAGASQSTQRRIDCIMYRESRYQSDARHHNRNGSWDLGLFQINSIHAGQFRAVTGQDYWANATNPYLNAQYAVWLWRQAGLSPWAGGCLL